MSEIMLDIWIFDIQSEEDTRKCMKSIIDMCIEDTYQMKKEQHDCCICLETHQECAELNICKHRFCKSCITKWFEKSEYCPICKQSSITYS